jgi:hypothetical protein
LSAVVLVAALSVAVFVLFAALVVSAEVSAFAFVDFLLPDDVFTVVVAAESSVLAVFDFDFDFFSAEAD